MYVIEIPKPFTMADGQLFRKVKVDKDGKAVRACDEKGELLSPSRDKDGNQQWQLETEPASYLDMLSQFLNRLFSHIADKSKEDKSIKTLQLEDSSLALDIFRAIHVANKALELEKTPYEWLKKMLETYGADVELFGINAALMLEPLQKVTETSPIRAERRREAKSH